MGRPLPPALDEALSGASVEPALRALVRARFGDGTALGALRARLVKRRVVRFELELAPRAGHAPATWSVIGKVYESPERGAEAFRTLGWLGQQGLRAGRGAAVPEAYAYSAEARTVFMQDVGGRALKQLLRGGEARPEHARLLAEALAQLHAVPAELGRPFTLDDHLAQRCAGLCGALAQAFPAVAGDLAEIVARARAQPPGAATLAHGDFHPGQVHVDGERLWILDLDPLHQGDPAYDVAMVLVQLELLRRERPDPGLRALLAAFLERYAERRGPEPVERVPLQAALILLKRACKRFRYRDEPGWEATVARQLRCGAELARLQDELGALRGPARTRALLERCPVLA